MVTKTDRHGPIIMNRKTSGIYVLSVAAACLSLPASAADLPKSGKYSGHYGWTFTGQVQKLGADTTVYAGMGRAWSRTPMGTRCLSSGNARV